MIDLVPPHGEGPEDDGDVVRLAWLNQEYLLLRGRAPEAARGVLGVRGFRLAVHRRSAEQGLDGAFIQAANTSE